jgi:hypothetical protein
VTSAITSKSLSTWTTISPASSAVAATIKSATEGGGGARGRPAPTGPQGRGPRWLASDTPRASTPAAVCVWQRADLDLTALSSRSPAGSRC